MDEVSTAEALNQDGGKAAARAGAARWLHIRASDVARIGVRLFVFRFLCCLDCYIADPPAVTTGPPVRSLRGLDSLGCAPMYSRCVLGCKHSVGTRFPQNCPGTRAVSPPVLFSWPTKSSGVGSNRLGSWLGGYATQKSFATLSTKLYFVTHLPSLTFLLAINPATRAGLLADAFAGHKEKVL